MTPAEIVEAVGQGRPPAGLPADAVRAIEGELRYLRMKKEGLAAYLRASNALFDGAFFVAAYQADQDAARFAAHYPPPHARKPKP